jgi:hypothetical protein
MFFRSSSRPSSSVYLLVAEGRLAGLGVIRFDSVAVEVGGVSFGFGAGGDVVVVFLPGGWYAGGPVVTALIAVVHKTGSSGIWLLVVRSEIARSQRCCQAEKAKFLRIR